MELLDALQLHSLQQARVVAGSQGLHRTIRWVHIVDLPDPLPWVQSGDFLLTTGYSWPREEAEQRNLIYGLAKQGLTGVGLAVPRFFDQFPTAACLAAAELNFPLIEIPWEIPFNTITEEIHNSILAQHYKFQEQSVYIHNELLRVALEATSLQDITSTLGRLIARTVIIQHTDGPLLADYMHADEGNQVSMQTAEHEVLPKELYTQVEDKRYLTTLRSSTQPLRVSAIPENSIPARLICPIHIKRELVGLLWIVEGESPIGELDIRAVQYASIVMALHISQQRALASLEAQMGYSFLDSLLEGHFNPTPQALRRSEVLGFNSEGVYSVGMIVLNSQVPMSREGILKREQLAEHLKRRLYELQTPAVLSFTQNQIFFLLPDQFPVGEMWATINAPDVSLAVSRPYRGFEKVQQSYKEVCSIMPHLVFGQFHYYEDLLVARILMGDKEARSSFFEKLFGPLRGIKNGDILIKTMLAAARSGFHLKNTAEELRIHPKTLRYRLDRAITIGGFDFGNTETQFNLQLAARILALEDVHFL
ncbi:PucR family transcriptional regulator ligand-binding domain-containing protein [Paenibacillus sp. WQ 127069]|uniref:PucR family transcriptional regulator ligand-binding domain-containing protein n=1 Tax=Paenibacillus baimaensis TaxID=2982185 RepID=A0ABT2UGE4_9BACL|nr:PucR family transcriptional regulator [Paenibacillus sp. WQ 127069]MCU6793710.1 PucR family transcriptional regulator ligand-binding domain-containing protein [Paenibacillus sp. WQ 127069]